MDPLFFFLRQGSHYRAQAISYGPSNITVSFFQVTRIAGYANTHVFVFFFAPCGLLSFFYLAFASLDTVFKQRS